MDGVVERDAHGAGLRKDALHEGEELVVPAPAPPVVGEEHAVLVEEVLAEDLGVPVADDDVLLPRDVDHGRRLQGGEVIKLPDLARLRLLRDRMPRADAVLQEKVQVGPHPEILVPVAAVVLEPDEADLPAIRPAREAGPVARALPDLVGVLGHLEDLELDVLDGWRVEDDGAEGVDDEFLLHHLLDLHDLLLLLLAPARGHLVELLAARELGQEEVEEEEGEEVGDEGGRALVEPLVPASEVPGAEVAEVPDPCAIGLHKAMHALGRARSGLDVPDEPEEPRHEEHGGGHAGEDGPERVPAEEVAEEDVRRRQRGEG